MQCSGLVHVLKFRPNFGLNALIKKREVAGFSQIIKNDPHSLCWHHKIFSHLFENSHWYLKNGEGSVFITLWAKNHDIIISNFSLSLSDFQEKVTKT